MARRQLTTTDEGLELIFAVNHLAPFLLTRLLLGLMKASSPARIVTVSSAAHRNGKINLADLQGEQNYAPIGAYTQSKLANILFTYELARRLDGTGVTANCLHPGLVATNMFRDAPFWMGALLRVARPLMLSPKQGAETVIHLASSPEIIGFNGAYFEKCRRVESSRMSYDQRLAKSLWSESKRLTQKWERLPG